MSTRTDVDESNGLRGDQETTLFTVEYLRQCCRKSDLYVSLSDEVDIDVAALLLGCSVAKLRKDRYAQIERVPSRKALNGRLVYHLSEIARVKNKNSCDALLLLDTA